MYIHNFIWYWKEFCSLY